MRERQVKRRVSAGESSSWQQVDADVEIKDWVSTQIETFIQKYVFQSLLAMMQQFPKLKSYLSCKDAFKRTKPFVTTLNRFTGIKSNHIFMLKDRKLNWSTTTVFWLKFLVIYLWKVELLIPKYPCYFINIGFFSSDFSCKNPSLFSAAVFRPDRGCVVLTVVSLLSCSPWRPQMMPSGTSSGLTPPPASRTSLLWFQPLRSGPLGRNLPQTWQPSATR